MEISEKNENKGTKYNHVAPIDFDSIPVEEREQALKEFAEGSIGLEKCLRVMWQKGLKTHACCAGNDSPYDEGYIAMATKIDAFRFLSSDILNNDMVVLEVDGDKQIIRFAGTPEEKEKAMLLLADSILSGEKENGEKLKEKIGKSFPFSWIKETNAYFMRKSGMSEEEIAFELRGLELNWIMSNGSQKEIDSILPELEERTKILMERIVERHNKGK